jgi:hypothetical protein
MAQPNLGDIAEEHMFERIISDLEHLIPRTWPPASDLLEKRQRQLALFSPHDQQAISVLTNRSRDEIRSMISRLSRRLYATDVSGSRVLIRLFRPWGEVDGPTAFLMEVCVQPPSWSERIHEAVAFMERRTMDDAIRDKIRELQGCDLKQATIEFPCGSILEALMPLTAEEIQEHNVVKQLEDHVASSTYGGAGEWVASLKYPTVAGQPVTLVIKATSTTDADLSECGRWNLLTSRLAAAMADALDDSYSLIRIECPELVPYMPPIGGIYLATGTIQLTPEQSRTMWRLCSVGCAGREVIHFRTYPETGSLHFCVGPPGSVHSSTPLGRCSKRLAAKIIRSCADPDIQSSEMQLSTDQFKMLIMPARFEDANKLLLDTQALLAEMAYAMNFSVHRDTDTVILRVTRVF